MSVDLASLVNNLNGAAASWYNAVTTNTPVLPPPTSGAAIAAGQAILNQQAQARLITTSPTLAGILGNPIFLIFAVGLVVLLIVFALKR